MKMKTWLLMLLTASSFGTTCYTDCADRFPKWYQEPDRKRCQAEKAWACLDNSQLPGAQDLSQFNEKAEEVLTRLERNFLEEGYVVSRTPEGNAEHQGDSLIWSGIALASLPCDRGEVIESALIRSVKRQGGRFLRIDPLPSSYGGNETSRDAEVGAMFGFALRSQHCPSSRGRLADAWESHYNFVKSRGKLHEGNNPNFLMNPGIEFVWNLVSHDLGHGSRPGKVGLAAFESAMIISSKSIARQKSACYPIHLSTLMAVTADKLGMPINELTKREFCHDTRGMELPLTEWFCGRGDVKSFLSHFRYNQYEYRHQRCRWESPDVDPGHQSPGVDFLSFKALAG